MCKVCDLIERVGARPYCRSLRASVPQLSWSLDISCKPKTDRFRETTEPCLSSLFHCVWRLYIARRAALASRGLRFRDVTATQILWQLPTGLGGHKATATAARSARWLHRSRPGRAAAVGRSMVKREPRSARSGLDQPKGGKLLLLSDWL